MKDIVWDKSLSIDVDEVDDDHRRLVDVFNVLSHAVADGESADYLEAVLQELINCTVWHFSHEERLMLKYGYAERAEHKAEHRELIDSVKALQAKFLVGDRQLSGKEIEYLEHWLTEHIYVADMKMGAFLADAM